METTITRQVKLVLNKCPLCGHEWRGIVKKPKACPHCKQYNWDKEKKK